MIIEFEKSPAKSYACNDITANIMRMASLPQTFMCIATSPK